MADEEKTNRTEYTVEEKSVQEGQKLLFDTFKHLTTLSTGSILIIATFVKDIFKSPEWPFLIGVAFGLLILSMVSSFLVMIAMGDSVHKSSEPSKFTEIAGAAGVFISIGGFLLGIIALAVFAMKNFY